MSSEQQPSSTPSTNPKPAPAPEPEPAFGWNAYAEKINGRLAMVAFVVLLVLEYFTRQDLITWLGLR